VYRISGDLPTHKVCALVRPIERSKQVMHDLEEAMIRRADAITVNGRYCHIVEALAGTGIGRGYLLASEGERTTRWLLLSYAVMVSLGTTYVDTMSPTV